MKIIKKFTQNTVLILFSTLVLACGKEFLEKKSNQKLLVPTALEDFRALMDNSKVMNIAPFLNEIASDDLYTTDAYLQGASTIIRNSYKWEKDVYEGGAAQDWTMPYEQIFYANVVLDGLQTIDKGKSTGTELDELKGTALFFRAFAMFNLSQTFAAPYAKETAAKLPGLPSPRVSDVNIKYGRGTLTQTFELILKDLKEAEGLLPVQVTHKTRPDKAAVLGLLAKVYLIMSDFENSLTYANRYLNLRDKLIDYNTVSSSPTRTFPNPITGNNEEVTFYASMITTTFFITSTSTIVDSVLYSSYPSHDLRKKIFFNNRGNKVITMKGSYTGAGSPFTGIATDEIYLIKAECEARKGMPEAAMKTLNLLLEKRYSKPFIPATASSATEAIKIILSERRKELVFRNTRWGDLRRLNQDPSTETVLKRVIKGEVYLLEPQDKRYVFPIPDNELSHNNIEQNPR